MTEFILVYRRRDDPSGPYYTVGSDRQGALDALVYMFEHYSGVYSYVLYNFTLRGLRWQLDAAEPMVNFQRAAKHFLEVQQVLWGETGPGLEKREL